MFFLLRLLAMIPIITVTIPCYAGTGKPDSHSGEGPTALLVPQQLNEAPPRLSPQDANTAAIRWLKRSQEEFAKVPKIPYDFPDEHWWPEMLRTYVDAGDSKAAGRFATRWHKLFGQSYGREAIRLTALRLSRHGEFDAARKTALVLVSQNNPMLYGYSPHANEQLCVYTLAQIAGRQAAAGDFAGAEETANLIPRKRYTRNRADAFYSIARAYARAADAKGIARLRGEFMNQQIVNRPKSFDQEMTLVLAVELAMAGAVEDARQMADVLPASSRRQVQARIAVAQAVEGDWQAAIETGMRISQGDESQLALLRIAAVRAWLGDHTGAHQIVEQHIQADRVSHPYRSRFFLCRKTLGQATAWSGNFVSAEQYASTSDLAKVCERVLLDPILDFSSLEEGVIGEDHELTRGYFESPRRISVDGTSGFVMARQAALSVLGRIHAGESLPEPLDECTPQIEEDDYPIKVYTNMLLGAVCQAQGDRELAVRYFNDALGASDETDFNSGQLPYLLCSLVKQDEADAAVRRFRRLAQVRQDDRRMLSELAARLAFAVAETGEMAQIEALLENAPRDADRALICLGAAQGTLSAARSRSHPTVPSDAYELLVRSNLELPLPEVR